MIQSPEMQGKIAEWRAKQQEGTMTLQDWLEAFRYMRSDRNGAQTASAASKAKSKAPVDVGALKDSLKAFAKKP